VTVAVRCEANLRVPMRDGVTLSADVYLPAGAGPHPALVARTPYNKNTAEASAHGRRYAGHGYAFVWIDVRGRGDSDGEFTPYRHEGPDGHDAIEWVAAQPWSDGRVGTWGQSYLGQIQWTAALEQPPHLCAMVVYVPPSDPWVEWPTGVHGPQQLCWHRMVDGRLNQHVDDVDWMATYEHVPLLTMDEHAGFRSRFWRDDLSHPSSDAGYWAQLAYQDRLGELDIPVLHVSGWYDDVQPATLINFTRMIRGARSERARRGQRLVMGPWDHGLTRTRARRLGDIDFGEEAERFDLDAHELRWLDHYLRGEDNGAHHDPRVRIFVMGANVWRDEDAWPLERVQLTRYHLSSAGHANTASGDGVLRREAPPTAAEPPDAYRSDPADPVPFLTEPVSAQIGGPDDYRDVEEREDVLVYSTPPLEDPVEVTGPVRVELYASSDRPDTDFMAKLIDVHPDGFCQRICDGMVRARYREGMDRERPMRPGVVERFEIHLWNTSQVFLPGHRIRLEVASTAFPKYDRNPNTGGPLATETAAVVAENRVWHTPEQPSSVILPVVAAS
jgi:putative CocE/NonD family hydrolase